MAEDKIKPFIEVNLIVSRQNYPQFIRCIKRIKVLVAKGKPIPSNLAEQLYDCIYQKDYQESIQKNQKITRLTKKAVIFFDGQQGYNFSESNQDLTDQYDEYEGPFSNQKSNAAKKRKRFTNSYSLEQFIKKTVSDYFYLYHFLYKSESKKTFKRDCIITFFYQELVEYIKLLPKDPLKSGKGDYKKKVVAVYLTHLVNPIKEINGLQKITCQRLFKIADNLSRKMAPKLNKIALNPKGKRAI